MTDSSKALSPAAQKFILHWGEMDTRGGINHTVAQVHALLLLSDCPLSAEEVRRRSAPARLQPRYKDAHRFDAGRAVPVC